MRSPFHRSGVSRATLILTLGTLGGVMIFAASAIAPAGGSSASTPATSDETVAPNTASAPTAMERSSNTSLQERSSVRVLDTATVPGATPDTGEGAVDSASLATNAPAPVTGSARFAMPLGGWSAVTDRYGAPRGAGYYHGGIDLALDYHTPVYASCAGTVSTTALSSVYGNYIVIDCGEGWATLYAHLSSIAVYPGQRVAQGGTIGISGSTGFSTGEHLHFEIHYFGGRVNPEHYLDFKIPPGTPLYSGPATIMNSGGGSSRGSSSGGGTTGVSGDVQDDATTEAEDTATPEPTETPEPTATFTPTNTPTATATFTPTFTPTPLPPTPTRTPTPRPVAAY